MTSNLVRIVGGVLGTLLLVVGTATPALATQCCTCVGCPTGVTACLTVPSEVDVCAQLGCTGVSTLCLPGNCTPGREEICPANEAGQCADGADNDFNGQVDCADSACADTIVCRAAAAPMLDPFGVGALLLAISAIELWRRRRAMSAQQKHRSALS